MKKISNKTRITIGVCLILAGLAFISSEYLTSKKHGAYERITFEISNIPTEKEEPDQGEIPDEEISDTVIIDDEDGNSEEIFINDSNYIGRLEIPTIKLVKGFVSKDSSANNVNKNIAIMSPSNYPDVDKGNFILAGHTGNAWNSFFKNLYKLKVGNEAYVYYNNVKYTYKLTRIYYQEKTGVARIYRDVNKTTMTLITCTKGTKTSQTIFVFELQTKTNI